MDLFNLQGKIALVTGSLGLIGKEHCRALAHAGATVIVADLNYEACAEFASTLPNGAVGLAFEIDVLNHLHCIIFNTSHKVTI